MQMKKSLTLISLLAIGAVILAGCNLPLAPTPTPFVFPTPNMTMTALFNPTLLIPPTVTLPPVQTATSAPQENPTATQPPQVQPTSTQPAPTLAVATATSKPAAQPSATPNLDIRTGVSIEAAYVATPPTIDGEWTEWNARAYPAAAVVWGKDNWKDDADLEASFRAAWDNTNLYIAVKTRDDAYVQNATGKEIFMGDSVEILLDSNVRADYYVSDINADDFKLGLSPGSPTAGNMPFAYLWYPAAKEGAQSGVKIAAVSSAGVWRLEAAIPWSVFGISPASGQHFGFGLSVSDNDNPAKNAQQTMVSNLANRDFTDPTTWGDLTLKK
jgi:hypothetical protein